MEETKSDITYYVDAGFKLGVHFKNQNNVTLNLLNKLKYSGLDPKSVQVDIIRLLASQQQEIPKDLFESCDNVQSFIAGFHNGTLYKTK